MGYKKWLVFLIGLSLGCRIVPATPLPKEIPAAVQVATPVAVVQSAQQAPPQAPPAAAAAETAAEAPTAPAPNETPPPAVTPEPAPAPFFLQEVTMAKPPDPARQARALDRHGLLIAFLLPLLVFGVPWLILELFIVRYVQPRGIDLSTVRIKAADGMFVEAAMSITARRSLTLASTRMTWSNVRAFVEKTIEQELIHEALNFASLDDLERGLKGVTENFLELPIVKELSRNFGVEVLRFNVETRYPSETIAALNRKAEASAGGAAYIAFATAAHYDPDAPESRQLYQVYQETSSQVDAARNLGGGIGSLAKFLSSGRKEDSGEDDASD